MHDRQNGFPEGLSAALRVCLPGCLPAGGESFIQSFLPLQRLTHSAHLSAPLGPIRPCSAATAAAAILNGSQGVFGLGLVHVLTTITG